MEDSYYTNVPYWDRARGGYQEVENVMAGLNEEEINTLFEILEKLSSANADPEDEA